MTRHRAQLVHEGAQRNGTEQITLDECIKSTEVLYYTVKTALFGASSSLPPLVDRRGKLVWSADEKT